MEHEVKIIPKEEIIGKRPEKYSERFDNDKSPIGNPETWGKRLVDKKTEERKKQCELRKQHLSKKYKSRFSEEETKKIAFDFYYDMSKKMNVPENLITENKTNLDVWFEQFKKK